MSPDWTVFAAAVSVLALAVAALGGREDPTDERLAALPWRAVVGNAAFSQALVAALTLGAVWLAGVPFRALALGPDAFSVEAFALGLGTGAALAALNGLLSVATDRTGVSYAEELRELLTPGTLPGWVALLGGVLPLVAVAEELLFRGALVAALAAGFTVSPWALALASSLVFGVAHGAQGNVGAVAAGVLGFALAATLVVTDSLLVPIVAHYVVNAVEFLGVRASRR